MTDKIVFDILGYFGSSLLTIMMYPQVYLTIKTNKTDDLSINFVVLNFIATICLVPYSIYYNIIPIAIANISLLICNFILLSLYIKNTFCNKKINNNKINMSSA